MTNPMDSADEASTELTISEPDSNGVRLAEDERALRRLPLSSLRAETATPSSSSDVDSYEEMRILFNELAEMTRAIRADPNALKSPLGGGYDVSMLRAITAMYDALRKNIESVAKMKSSDRLTLAILESHTRAMSQNLAIPLGEKIRATLEALDSGEPDEAKAILLSLVRGDIVTIFREAATQAMLSSRELYNIQ